MSGKRSRGWLVVCNPSTLGFAPEESRSDDESSGARAAPPEALVARAAERSEAILTDLSTHCRYVVGQLEYASQLHLQSYVYFDQPQTFTAIKRLVPYGAHIEPANGNCAQNTTYCTKTETRQAGPWTYGDCPAQGKRSDLDAFADDVRTGTIRTIRQAFEAHPKLVIRNPRGVQLAIDIVSAPKPRDTMPTVMYIYGPAGVGKTHFCHEFAKSNDMQVYSVESRERDYRFTQYTGQQVVLFDEVCFSRAPREFWLQLFDRYPFTVPRFGVPNIEFNSPYIFMTSNLPPPAAITADFAMARRIKVHHMVDRLSVPQVHG